MLDGTSGPVLEFRGLFEQFCDQRDGAARPVNRPPAAGNNPAMAQATDAELIARSRDEPSAFAGVYERYATTIYRYQGEMLHPVR